METSNLKLGINCSIRYIITALITFFIYLSITVVIGGIFYESVGYTVYHIENGENQGELYRYSYSEGEDTKYAEYEAQGYELMKIETPKKLTGIPKLVTDGVTQIAGAVILFAFVYGTIWKIGDSDRNLIALGNRQSDKFRGIKIGLLSNMPIYFSYLIFIIAKSGLISGTWYAVFRFLNFPLFTFINALYGQSTSTAANIPWLNVGLGALTFIVLPLFAHIAYTLGLKRISISERIVYKKKKV